MISNLMVQINGKNAETLSEDLVRHMVLNSLRAHNKKFRKEYGEMVIACDSGNVWRKQIFPNYKAGRKANREKSEHDWDAIFLCLNEIKDEIKDNLPYKFLEVYGAEADDIIGTLCATISEEIMIISGDKDFIQLQRFPNVKQFSPITKKTVNGTNPGGYLKEHVFRGDSGDGVPNVLSPDNTFTDGLRQRPLGKKKIASWMEHDFEDVAPNDEVKRN